MKIMVLWSGGMDSTFLIWKLLREGHEVTATYIDIMNNATKTKRELKSITKISKLFSVYSFTLLPTQHVSISPGHNMYLQQTVCWGLVLPVCEDMDELHLGYIMNDDAVSFIPEIKQMFNGYKGLIQNLPKLKFPLLKYNKQYIWNNLPEKIRKHTTWCESPRIKDNCGTCIPCKRHKTIKT